MYFIKSLLSDKYLYLLLFFIILFFLVTQPFRNWSLHVDQEFTLAYNATLINAGINQEYLDHPGFITIQLTALIIKIFKLFGISSVQNIFEINQSTQLFTAFQEIVIAARFLSALTISLIITGWYVIAKYFFKSSLLVAAVITLIFFSDSLLFHFFQLRTEPISFILLIISCILLASLYKLKKYTKLFMFFLVLLTFFLSALNKTQIIVYAPIYYLWVILFFSNPPLNTRIYTYQSVNQNVIALISSGICLYLAFIIATGISQYFNVLFIIIIYFIIFISWKINGGNLSIQITAFNVLFIFAFLTIQYLLKLVSTNYYELLERIINPLGMLIFTPHIKSAINASLTIQHFDFLSFIKFLITPILDVVFYKFNSQFILFWTNILIWISLYKSISFRKNLLIIFSYIAFFLIIIISSFRVTPQYILFSEFFLIYLFCFLVHLINSVPIKYLLVLFCTFSIIFLSIPKLILEINYNINTYNKLCDPNLDFDNDYMRWWHRKLDHQKFLLECKVQYPRNF